MSGTHCFDGTRSIVAVNLFGLRDVTIPALWAPVCRIPYTGGKRRSREASRGRQSSCRLLPSRRAFRHRDGASCQACQGRIHQSAGANRYPRVIPRGFTCRSTRRCPKSDGRSPAQSWIKRCTRRHQRTARPYSLPRRQPMGSSGILRSRWPQV